MFASNLLSCSVSTKSKTITVRTLSSKEIDSCLESLHALLRPAGFLRQNNNELHQSRYVIRASQGVPGIKTPEQKIAYWLLQLDGRLKNSDDAARGRDVELLRRFYRLNYIVKKDNVSESYFDAQRRIMREQGRGDVPSTDAMRSEKIGNIKRDQRESLDTWIDYLLSSDADQYPIWVRYWSFEGMLKLGVLNGETGKFSKRTTSTVAPFAELNREAYAEVVDVLVRRINGDSLDDLTDETFKQLVQSGASFAKLYERQLVLAKEGVGTNLLSEASGVWVKYDKGSSADDLVESLKGKGTGWCTAGHSTAASQLKKGDFYVYYTKDQSGQMSNPRIAIRMEGEEIAEVRGVGPNQNIDQFMAGADILDKKLLEFGPEGERYTKRSSDMKKLTEIERKHKNKEELTKDELRFLYELDSKIEGFGYEKDPRIMEITSKRNFKQDLSFAVGCKESEISLTKEEALRGGMKYHIGDLDLRSLTLADGLKLPDNVGGSLYLSSLTSADGFKLPDSVGRSLDLSSLTSADGLKLPDRVGGSLDLRSLTSADGLKLPDSVGRYLDLRSLTSADGLKLPDSVGGPIYLNSLTSADELVIPPAIDRREIFY